MHLRLSTINELEYVFDPVRKKYVRLTPEEWVRQHLLNFLIEYKDVPAQLIGIEKQFSVNRLSKRFDLVIFNRSGNALVLAECKAPSVNISQAVFDQAARYNLQLRVDYFMITNGLQHFSCKLDYMNGVYRFLQEIPVFSEL